MRLSLIYRCLLALYFQMCEFHREYPWRTVRVSPSSEKPLPAVDSDNRRTTGQGSKNKRLQDSHRKENIILSSFHFSVQESLRKTGWKECKSQRQCLQSSRAFRTHQGSCIDELTEVTVTGTKPMQIQSRLNPSIHRGLSTQDLQS